MDVVLVLDLLSAGAVPDDGGELDASGVTTLLEGVEVGVTDDESPVAGPVMPFELSSCLPGSDKVKLGAKSLPGEMAGSVVDSAGGEVGDGTGTVAGTVCGRVEDDNSPVSERVDDGPRDSVAEG